jgi:hypothetical protein
MKKAYYVQFEGSDQSADYKKHVKNLENYTYKTDDYTSSKKLVLILSPQSESSLSQNLNGILKSNSVTVEQITSDTLDDESKLHSLLSGAIDRALNYETLEGL